MRRRTWIALAATGVVLITAIVVFATDEPYLGEGGGASNANLVVREIESSDRRVVEISSVDVASDLPRFHDLLEEAHAEGASYTRDEKLIDDIWAYIDEQTGTRTRQVDLRYNGKLFELLHSVK